MVDLYLSLEVLYNCVDLGNDTSYKDGGFVKCMTTT
jgi:hypothetical protein